VGNWRHSSSFWHHIVCKDHDFFSYYLVFAKSFKLKDFKIYSDTENRNYFTSQVKGI
jgi:hypothetical protein